MSKNLFTQVGYEQLSIKKFKIGGMSVIIDNMSLIKYNIIMTEQYDIEIYSNKQGKEPFSEWLESLRDKKVKLTIFMRIQRLREGNLGDYKTFEGLYELRIDFGPGYRVYCAKAGSRLILLLGGGDKGSQDRDIKKCKAYLEDHKRRTL